MTKSTSKVNFFFIALIIFMIPLSPVLPRIGFFPQIRLDEIALLIFSFFWLINYFWENGTKIPIEAKGLNTIFIWYLCASLLPETLNIIMGNTLVNSLTPLIFINKIQYFILAQIVFTSLKDFNTAKKYVFLIILASGVVAIVGILQYFRIPFIDTILKTYNTQGLSFIFTSDGLRRITSFFPNPNNLTVYLAFISVIIFSLLSHNSMNKYTVVLYIIFTLDVVALFLTGSRTGLFIFLLAILIVLLFKRDWKLIFVLCIMMAAGASMMPEAFTQRIYNAVDISNGVLIWDKSFMGRLDGVSRVLPIIQNNLLFGIGNVLKNSFPISADQSYLVNLDSEYIRILLANGLLGLLMYLVFIGLIIKTLVKDISDKNSPFIKALSLGILAGFIGLLVGDTVGTAFRTERLIEIFWILMAVVEYLKRGRTS